MILLILVRAGFKDSLGLSVFRLSSHALSAPTSDETYEMHIDEWHPLVLQVFTNLVAGTAPGAIPITRNKQFAHFYNPQFLESKKFKLTDAFIKTAKVIGER